MSHQEILFHKIERLVETLGINKLIDEIVSKSDQTNTFFTQNSLNLQKIFKHKEIFGCFDFLSSEKISDLFSLLFKKIFENFLVETPEKINFLNMFHQIPLKKNTFPRFEVGVEIINILVDHMYEKQENKTINQHFIGSLKNVLIKLRNCFIISTETINYILKLNCSKKLELIELFVDFSRLDSNQHKLIDEHLSRFSYMNLIEFYPFLLQKYISCVKTKVRLPEILRLLEKNLENISNTHSFMANSNSKFNNPLLQILIELVFSGNLEYSDREKCFDLLLSGFEKLKTICAKFGNNLPSKAKLGIVKIFSFFIKKATHFFETHNFLKTTPFLESIKNELISIVVYLVFIGESSNYMAKKSICMIKNLYSSSFDKIFPQKVEFLILKPEIKKEITLQFFANMNYLLFKSIPDELFLKFEEKTLDLLTNVDNKNNKKLCQYFFERIKFLSQQEIVNKEAIIRYIDMIIANNFIYLFSFDYSNFGYLKINFTDEEITKMIDKIESKFEENYSKLNSEKKKFKNRSLKSFFEFLYVKNQNLTQAKLLEFILKEKAKIDEKSKETQKEEEKEDKTKLQTGSNNLATRLMNLPNGLLEKMTNFEELISIFKSLVEKLSVTNFEFCQLFAEFVCKWSYKSHKIQLMNVVQVELNNLKLLVDNTNMKDLNNDLNKSFWFVSLLICNKKGLIFDDSTELGDLLVYIQNKVLNVIIDNKIFNSNFCSVLALGYFPILSKETCEGAIDAKIAKILKKIGYPEIDFMQNRSEDEKLLELIDKKIKLQNSHAHKNRQKLFLKNITFYNRLFFHFLSKYILIDKVYMNGLISSFNEIESETLICDFIDDLDQCAFDPDINLSENISVIFSAIEPILKECNSTSFKVWCRILTFLEKLLSSAIKFDFKEKIFGISIILFCQKISIFNIKSIQFLDIFRPEQTSGILTKVFRQVMRLFFYQKIKNEIDDEFQSIIFKQSSLSDNYNKIILSIYLSFFKMNYLQNSFESNLTKIGLNNEKIIDFDILEKQEGTFSNTIMHDKIAIFKQNQINLLNPGEAFIKQFLKIIYDEMALKQVLEIDGSIKFLVELSKKTTFGKLLKSSSYFRLLQNMLICSSKNSIQIFLKVYRNYVEEDDSKNHLRLTVLCMLFKILNKINKNADLEVLFFEELKFLTSNFRVKNLEKFVVLQKMFFKAKILNKQFLTKIFDYLKSSSKNASLLSIYFANVCDRPVMKSDHWETILQNLNNTESNSNQQYFIILVLNFLLSNIMSTAKYPEKTSIEDSSYGVSVYSKLCDKFDLSVANLEVFCDSLKRIGKHNFENEFLQKVGLFWIENVLDLLASAKIENDSKEKMCSELIQNIDLLNPIFTDGEKFKEKFLRLKNCDYRIIEVFYISVFTKNCFYYSKIGEFLNCVAFILENSSLSTLQKFETFLKKYFENIRICEIEIILNYLRVQDIRLEIFWLINAFLPAVKQHLRFVNEVFKIIQKFLKADGFLTEKEKLAKSLSGFSFLLNSYLNLSGIEFDFVLVKDVLKSNLVISYLS